MNNSSFKNSIFHCYLRLSKPTVDYWGKWNFNLSQKWIKRAGKIFTRSLIAVLFLYVFVPVVDAQTTTVSAKKPEVFAPGIISRASHDAVPAFTPDGHTVFFQQSNGSGSTILISHLEHGHWSQPIIASFSGKWNDMEPAMSPDGSYLLFISSRPIKSGGKQIDGYFNGKPQSEQGSNIWRVDRTRSGWGKPHRLPTVINSNTSIYAPSIAENGNLYFIQPDKSTQNFRLFCAKWNDGHYSNPEPLPFSTGETTDVDPAISPDEHFLVFGSSRKPAADIDLFIVFQDNQG